MPKRLAKSRVITVGLLITALYFTIGALFDNAAIINILNGVFLGVLVALGIVYTPLVWASLKAPRFTRVPQLAIGIACLWLSIGIGQLWYYYYRLQGGPEHLLNSSIIGFIVLLAIIGGLLFITAPGYEAEEYLTVRWGGDNRWLIVTAVLAGVVVALIAGHFGAF